MGSLTPQGRGDFGGLSSRQSMQLQIAAKPSVLCCQLANTNEELHGQRFRLLPDYFGPSYTGWLACSVAVYCHSLSSIQVCGSPELAQSTPCTQCVARQSSGLTTSLTIAVLGRPCVGNGMSDVSLFHREVSELPRPIAVKLCQMVGSMFCFII